jgi:hypothetical protein
MHTRYIPAALLALVGCLAGSMTFAQSPPPQSPASQGQAGVSAETSGQDAHAVGRSGAAAQGAGSSEAGGRLGDHTAQVAAGSSANAVLTKPVDSAKAKPGDPVSGRITQAARTSDGTVIPEGSTLIGHISEVRARGDGQASSAVGMVFDRAVMKDGREIPLRNVGIRALAAAEGANAASVGDGGTMMGGGGAMTGGASGRGGGLVGRTSGAVGGTLGGGPGTASAATGSLGGTARGALQAGPGALGGLEASWMLRSNSSGVFGLRDVSLASGASSSTQGSVVTSTGRSVRLDQGTRMLLSAQASGNGNRAPEPARPSTPKGSEPDRR